MMRILIEAPILTQSGYGEHSRLVYRALSNIDGAELFVNPLAWGSTSWSADISEDMKKSLKTSIANFRKDQEIQKKSSI